jgi:tetratricopeptide (TPR) repeat protein
MARHKQQQRRGQQRRNARRAGWELECGGCGGIARYEVGRIWVDPEVSAGLEIEKAVAFEAWMTCIHCGAEGPWHPTAQSLKRILIELITSVMGGEPEGQVSIGQMTTFDGYLPSSLADAVAHLREVMAERGEDAFLRDRLGNAYYKAGRVDQAVSEFERAVELDETCVNAQWSLAAIHWEERRPDAAAAHLHAVIRHAPVAYHTPENQRVDLVAAAVDTLVDIHHETGGRIPILPEAGPAPALAYDRSPGTLQVLHFNLGSPAQARRLARWLVVGPDAARRSVAGGGFEGAPGA